MILLNKIEKDKGSKYKRCCMELFDQWLQNAPQTGRKARTWRTLVNVLRDEIGTEPADRIEEILSKTQ